MSRPEMRVDSTLRQKRVVITGITGTLGRALGATYVRMGWQVTGVGRGDGFTGPECSEYHQNRQESWEDATRLLAFDPDVLVLNAGQIETDVGVEGMPLRESLDSILNINTLFPSRVAIAASERVWKHRIEIVIIGSIADGSPSCFGPIYHMSKIAAHYFVSGVGPILLHANREVRLRLYRPGAIKGPLAWAPVVRLNETGYRIRSKRVNSAPEAPKVAQKIVRWIGSGSSIGTYEEPFSFKIFKYLFVLAPDFFFRLQMLGWRKGSKFAGGER